MSRQRPTTDFVRAGVSTIVSGLLAAGLTVLVLANDPGPSTFVRDAITAFVIVWPTYTAIYVGWSLRVYTRLDTDELAALATREGRDERRWYQQAMGLTGAMNTTVTAAIMAVIITVVIAQRPEFGDRPLYVALALLSVASSWVLMVFTFAQNYLRLAAESEPGRHLRFHFPEEPTFADYLTLSVLLSTMAALATADIKSRRASHLVRTNVILAFVFNTVIIAMMVSLLFGGLGG